MHKRNETIENYLESIYLLDKKGPVHAIDIVHYFNYSRPTVSVAIKQMQKNGYIVVTNNVIKLTDSGLKIALEIYERHQLIAEILVKMGVDPKVASADSCKIEHDLSRESFEAIKKACRWIEKHEKEHSKDKNK